MQAAESRDQRPRVAEQPARRPGGQRKVGKVRTQPGGVRDQKEVASAGEPADQAVLPERMTGKRNGKERAVAEQIAGLCERRPLRSELDRRAILDGARAGVEVLGQELGEEGVAQASDRTQRPQTR